MSRPARSRTVTAAAALTLLLALTGCTDDPAEPTPGPSASDSAPTDSPSAGDSPTEEPSETSTVPAATGPLLKLEGAQMNAPAGWKPLPDIVRFATEANPPTGIGAAGLSSLAFPGTGPSLDAQAKTALKGSNGRGTKRQPDVEIAGEEFYHLAGKISDYRYYEEFGTIANGYNVLITFSLPAEMPDAEKQQIVEESVASFAWR